MPHKPSQTAKRPAWKPCWAGAGYAIASVCLTLARQPLACYVSIAPSSYDSVVCCIALRVVALASASGDAALTDADYELINKLLAWPATALFPALDLARLLALDVVASQHLAASAGSQPVAAANGQHLSVRQ